MALTVGCWNLRESFGSTATVMVCGVVLAVTSEAIVESMTRYGHAERMALPEAGSIWYSVYRRLRRHECTVNNSILWRVAVCQGNGRSVIRMSGVPPYLGLLIATGAVNRLSQQWLLITRTYQRLHSIK